MPPSPLKVERWRALLSDHSDRNFVKTLLGIITYGARVGYEGLRPNPVIYDNLSTVALEPNLVRADLEEQLKANRMKTYEDVHSLPVDTLPRL
jgi:hypothetical protein